MIETCVDHESPDTRKERTGAKEGRALCSTNTAVSGQHLFVLQAYVLGANDPYGAFKTTLKVEINEFAWATLHSDTSRPFQESKGGRIAVKVINHLGDEVMKVFHA